MRTCLIIDDSEMTRRLVRVMVSRLGCDVVEAQNGREALSLCERRMTERGISDPGLPDLMLIDWHMPVMDGMAFVARLRVLPGGDVPKVLMCTVGSDIEQIRHALSAGVDEVIITPFNQDVLAEKLCFTGDPVRCPAPRRR